MASDDAVADTIRRLQAVQLDSISAVERAHRLTIGSRVGAFGSDTENRLLAAGRVFEYWSHEACLLAIEDYPLMKRRMLDHHDRHWWGGARTSRELEDEVLEILRERGPLPARAFDGRNAPGQMWGWKPAKRALENLFASGEVAITRRDGFQRVYDLAERVIPAPYRDADTPSEAEFVREFAARAVEARGALTAGGIIEHCRLRGRRPILDVQLHALVADGRLTRLQVEDGGHDVFVPAGVPIDGAPSAAVLLCPFENLLWDRQLAPRLFGFDHVIEVYKPEPIRRYGYYVLPLLVRDRIVARVDLRRDRPADTLDVRAIHLEPKQRGTKALDAALRRALARVAASARVRAPDALPEPIA
ncbi:MAG: hypothetical protein JWM25_1210 [Thermoleophilia bacterium]|nr:hypothetical protein [Thermoleophilia bacterium]